MAGSRLVWQLFLSYLLIIALSLAAAAIFFSFSLGELYREQTLKNLESRARLLVPIMAEKLTGGGPFPPGYCESLGRSSNTRITLIDVSGTIICDSEEAPSAMDNHQDRPEVRSALSGEVGHRVRYSHTLDRHMVYVALPVWEQGRVRAALRTSMPLARVAEFTGRLHSRMLVGVALIAILSAAVAYMVSRRISRPLEEMKSAAERFADGDFSARLPRSSALELNALSSAMNEMALDLESRICSILRQRDEQESIFRSINEGLVAVDADDRVVTINRAAGEMLEADPQKLRGMSIQEAVRKPLLSRLLRDLSQKEEAEGEMTVGQGSDLRFLRVRAALIKDSAGERTGAVMVMTDITDLRKLENMRKEFVGNVSHELKTPVTSIKGFVETLLDGALESREDSLRFLGIISRQADQLIGLIDDLLLLSRIEQEAPRVGLEMSPASLARAVENAIETIANQAADRDVSLAVKTDPDIRIMMNQALIEHALANLLENAVNHSEAGSAVEVGARVNEGMAEAWVRDHGPGIEARHLPRLFERFYRVDKGRGRKQGGTGLGLAIAKHIVSAHGGTIAVESAPGRGSTFTIRLPMGETQK